MAELAKDECDLMAEERRRILKSLGQCLDGLDGGREVGGRSKIAQRKHGTVSLEQREPSVEQSRFHLGDRGLDRVQWKGRRRVDGCKVTRFVNENIYYFPDHI